MFFFSSTRCRLSSDVFKDDALWVFFAARLAYFRAIGRSGGFFVSIYISGRMEEGFEGREGFVDCASSFHGDRCFVLGLIGKQ